MKVKNAKAAYAFSKARSTMIVTQPFFGSLALHLDPVEVTDGSLTTMAVDGVHLFYCPKFVLSIKEDELQGVVTHETLHCAYKHMTRRGNRDPRRWNIAADFIINGDLHDAQIKLPYTPISLDEMKARIAEFMKTGKASQEKIHFYDPKLKGMSAEAVYEMIPELPVIQIMTVGVSGEGAGPRQQLPDDGCLGTVLDAAGRNEEGKRDQVDRDWDTNVRVALAVSKGQNAGTIPAYLQRLYEDLNKPKVSWRDLTRQFIDGLAYKDYSWQRPNRRFVGSGLSLPGFVPDALHKMIFLGDVSGSISNETMKAYLSEVAGALDENVADNMIVAYFDTEIKKVDEFLPGDVLTCDTPGGGGTDFRPAFQWVLDNHPDATCIVCLTDMCPCSWDLPDTEIPVLWAAYGNEAFVDSTRQHVPYGSVIRIDDI